MNTRRTRAQMKKNRTAASTVAAVVAQNPMGLLMLLSLFILAITGAYWHTNGLAINFNGSAFKAGKNGDLGTKERKALNARLINTKFTMGGVNLGMAQETVEDIHPDAQSTFDRAGEPVMTISTENAIMVAWLSSNNDIINVNGSNVRDITKRVYRLRRDEAFATMTEQDILHRYGREYGRPIDAACTRNGQGDSSRCSYRWWGGDGIQLQAIAKKKTDLNGQFYTHLTTIATNTIKSPKMSIVNLSNVSITQRLGYLN